MSTTTSPQRNGSAEHPDAILRNVFARSFAPNRLAHASESTRRQYQFAVDRFDEFLNRAALLADLNDSTVGEFLDWLGTAPHAARSMTTRRVVRYKRSTIANARACLLAVWRHLNHVGTVATGPNVPPLSLPRQQPASDEAITERRRVDATPLADDVKRYALYRGLRASTIATLGHVLNGFGRYLGHAPTRADLTDKSVSAWLESIEGAIRQATLYSYKQHVMILWRDLASQSLVAPPKRVRRVKKARPHPIAWTQDELAKLLTFVRRMAGTFRGTDIPRALYLESLIRAGYDSALRRSDLWALRRDHIRADGTITLVMQKTGWPHCPRLRPDTLSLVHRLPGEQPLANPFRNAHGWNSFWRLRVIQPCGIRPGGMQQLRRTSASHLARDYPAEVSRHLGHRSVEMVAFYIDWSVAAPTIHLPPALPGAPR
jgi:integrase